MPQHKKTPVFIRIKASNKQVVCINPLELSSFTIVEKAKFKVKAEDPKAAPEEREADSIHFYFPSGTGLTYRVGMDITQQDFDYICETLLEFMYLNEREFKAKSLAIASAQMDEFKKLSQENEDKLPKTDKPKEV